MRHNPEREGNLGPLDIHEFRDRKSMKVDVLISLAMYQQCIAFPPLFPSGTLQWFSESLHHAKSIKYEVL